MKLFSMLALGLMVACLPAQPMLDDELTGVVRADAGATDSGIDAGLTVDAGPRPDAGWTRMADLPRHQQECAVAALGDFVYVMGGFGLNAQLADVARYQVSTNQWTYVRPLPRPLHHLNVAALNGKLYVVGTLEGSSFAARGDTLEYDPVTDQWTTKAPLPVGTERGSSAVGAIGDEIYVAGGNRGGRGVSIFTAYNPTTNTHRTLPPLPTVTEHVVSGVVGTKLYVIGGRNGAIASITARVDVFDTATGQWTQGPNMPTARGGHAAGVVGTRIVVFGGEGNPATSSGVFAQTEILDTETQLWTTGPAMPTPRHGTGAAGVGFTVYLPGGAPSEGFDPTRISEAFTP